jgi:hypothetical protein
MLQQTQNRATVPSILNPISSAKKKSRKIFLFFSGQAPTLSKFITSLPGIHQIRAYEKKEKLSVWKIASRLFGALHKIPIEKTSPKNTEHWQYSQLQFNHRLHKSC